MVHEAQVTFDRPTRHRRDTALSSSPRLLIFLLFMLVYSVFLIYLESASLHSCARWFYVGQFICAACWSYFMLNKTADFIFFTRATKLKL